MNEDFVSYEIAKKLKEKGFKEKCIAYYWEKINEHTPSFVVEDKMPEDGLCLLDLLSNHNRAEWSPFIDAPTISQVLKWLREEKQIHISTTLYTGEENKWNHAIIDVETYKLLNLVMADNYVTCEASDIAGIEYVIDNLI